jgi:hypothetical protein
MQAVGPAVREWLLPQRGPTAACAGGVISVCAGSGECCTAVVCVRQRGGAPCCCSSWGAADVSLNVAAWCVWAALVFAHCVCMAARLLQRTPVGVLRHACGRWQVRQGVGWGRYHVATAPATCLSVHVPRSSTGSVPCFVCAVGATVG